MQALKWHKQTAFMTLKYFFFLSSFVLGRDLWRYGQNQPLVGSKLLPYTGLSKRGGGGIATVTRGPYDAY